MFAAKEVGKYGAEYVVGQLKSQLGDTLVAGLESAGVSGELIQKGMELYQLYSYAKSAAQAHKASAADPSGKSGLVAESKQPPEKKSTSRAARREAMREAGIPTSQQPLPASEQLGPRNTPQGKSYEYMVDGKRKGVQQTATPGRGETHGPHWEAGAVKGNEQTDRMGRPRLRSDKSRVEYEEE